MKKTAFIISLMLSITFAATAQSAVDSLKKVEIKVINLHCNNDMPTIKKRLLNQEGIDEVLFTDIVGDYSLFTVSYHTSVTSQTLIEKTIESTPGCDNKDETPYKVKRKKMKS